MLSRRYGIRSRQRGAGLIEVLIAVLVLSIGMLGMAGLQTWSLRNNQSALQRGQAVVQAYYIADAMRADRITAVNGGFNLGIDAAKPNGTSFADISRSAWRDSLVTALGAEATGSINCDGAICRIVVRWNDSRAQSGALDADVAAQDLALQVEL